MSTSVSSIAAFAECINVIDDASSITIPLILIDNDLLRQTNFNWLWKKIWLILTSQ